MDIQTLPPRTVIGNYKILKTLGRGGFGVAYVAWDCQLERNVVLKECFPTAICRREEDGTVRPLRAELEAHYLQVMADMQREARTLAKLNHERVVRVYEFFESRGGLYYVMPWLEGGSLREKMEEAADAGQPIAVQTAIQWLLAVLEGLQYLHDKGIVHRDIKPSNIMFDEHEHPVIIDFGASVMHAATTVTQGEFSADYAAPEQIAGKGAPFAGTDLFALAATAYELLSGSMPEPTLRRMLKDELVPIDSLPGMESLPQPLVQFVMQNLQLSPAARDKSAAYWRAVLSGMAECKPLPQPRPVGRWVWYAAAMGAMAVIVGIGASLLPKTPTPTAPQPQQAPPAAEALYRAYVAHNKASFAAAPAEYAAYAARVEAVAAEHHQACDAVLQQLEQELADTPRTTEQKSDLRDKYTDKIYDLEVEYSRKLTESKNAFYNQFVSPFNSLLTEPHLHYPAWRDADFAHLPVLRERLERTYGQYLVLPHHLEQPNLNKHRHRIDALLPGI
ncbi:MAG: serine/threonine protein kinase [Akkermansiaceae bacterium]|nr:serine/threonine protein kinase [Akkermansiaceae bacterium]